MTVGPNYEPPRAPVARGYSEATGGAPVAVTTPWWKTFGDPILDGLVQRALAANPSVARTQAAVWEARAAAREARAGGSPQLNGFLSGSAGRQFVPPSYVSESFGSVGFQPSWELDFWGKRRRQTEAAADNADAAKADADAARLALLGDVARAYVQLRGDQAAIAATRASIESGQRAVHLTTVRTDLGDGTELEILQAQSRLTALEARLPALVADSLVSAHALAILCGQPPETLDALLSTPRAIPLAPIPGLGIPADLLRQRPDVMKAERQLAQATATVGAALAERLPSLTLAGTLGLSGNNLARMLSLPIFVFTPAINLPVLDNAARRARVDETRARVVEALHAYRDAVLRAQQEVTDAMVRQRGDAAQVAKLARAAAIATRQLATSQLAFRIGAIDFLQVTDAQRALDESRLDLARARAAQATDTVALYKALGGGWASS